ncbi:hypothetical protein PTSG_02469 [Salpingoeca rosetta]|uniref:PH domain-containing protein n=1 Tax=Salpingoeca rosetta (strain ATCC 50818 / BSB-021) TaxID=946362 RepID=F2U2A5_SALR5|nr:uncharacterized protein PTSG_02469 [Salpingoeca rosetta]EGD81757.1 hypothetical protein PTSG_02469 [Salpingoeca rosetta]|eukprot:XP_004996961.1 hypothetical protein PTSG_02469 [Salpingoeca rosetta]
MLVRCSPPSSPTTAPTLDVARTAPSSPSVVDTTANTTATTTTPPTTQAFFVIIVVRLSAAPPSQTNKTKLTDPKIMTSTTQDDSEEAWTNAVLQAVPWYHPATDRHLAEVMLLDNGVSGSYLLRKSSSARGYVMSVRCQSSVQHFEVSPCPDGKSYRLGSREFSTLEEFVQHVAAKPALKGVSGFVTVLETPYNRVTSEEKNFAQIAKPIGGEAHRFVQTRREPDEPQRSLASGAREGYLVKRGRVVKNLKERWFVVDSTNFAYFKSQQTPQAIRTIPLNLAENVIPTIDAPRPDLFGFGIAFPKRTFRLFAHTLQDRKTWVEFLQWALKASKSGESGGSRYVSLQPLLDEQQTAAEDQDDQADD